MLNQPVTKRTTSQSELYQRFESNLWHVLYNNTYYIYIMNSLVIPNWGSDFIIYYILVFLILRDVLTTYTTKISKNILA